MADEDKADVDQLKSASHVICYLFITETTQNSYLNAPFNLSEIYECKRCYDIVWTSASYKHSVLLLLLHDCDADHLLALISNKSSL